MIENLQIRISSVEDLPDLERLYQAAFPQENLVPLVNELLAEAIPTLSLSSLIDGRLAGHVVFTFCRVQHSDHQLALLGPLAIHPNFQRQGMGHTIVNHGLAALREQHITKVLVLGDPSYYGRFGFRTEQRIHPPYILPDIWSEAWQSLSLTPNDVPPAGQILLPAPWLVPGLWMP